MRRRIAVPPRVCINGGFAGQTEIGAVYKLSVVELWEVTSLHSKNWGRPLATYKEVIVAMHRIGGSCSLIKYDT